MNRTIGWILVAINLLLAANAAFYFLAVKRLSAPDWLAVNTCTPSIILFALGFSLRAAWLMGFGAAWMLFYGGGGLIVFRWNAQPQDLVPQIGHVFMVLAAIYGLAAALMAKKVAAFLIGLALGILALIPAFQFQRRHQQEHPELVELLGFQDGFRPEGKQ